MVLAIAFDDAKTSQARNTGDGKNRIGVNIKTHFFSFRDDPDSPHATLNEYDAGRVSRSHFHIRDQFQLIIAGKGTLGRHRLAPYGVHFSRAYTPYGPLVADAVDGLAFLVMRAHRDPGALRLPDNEGKLKLVPDRQPWQITRPVTFASQSGATSADVMLQEIPGLKDEGGLAGHTLSMKPNAQAAAPDPSRGDGQYIVVVKGSLLHDKKEHRALALVFVGVNDGPFQVHAGAQGLEALVLNFPRLQARAGGEGRKVQATAGFKVFQCVRCAFVYNEAAGLPEDGIAPGIRWQDVPETWSCPDCGASKGDFEMIEL